MAMELLGRVLNPVAIAAGVAVNFQVGASMGFLCTGNDTFTLTISTSFAGSYVAPPTTAIGGGLIHNYYTNTATNGTAAWVKTKLAFGSYVNAVTIASGAVFFTVHGMGLTPFGAGATTHYQYIKCSVGAAGLVTVIAGELVHQRTPENLTILSA